jgi:hypothetical protein
MHRYIWDARPTFDLAKLKIDQHPPYSINYDKGTLHHFITFKLIDDLNKKKLS